MKLELEQCNASLGESLNLKKDLQLQLDGAATKITSQKEQLMQFSVNIETLTIDFQKEREQFKSENSNLLVSRVSI